MSCMDNVIELSERDMADLALLDGGLPETEQAPEPAKHTLLESWRALLSSVEEVAAQRILPQLANRIVHAWPKLTFADVPAYFAAYHARILEMREILLAEIDSDVKALTHREDDAVENKAHYLNLLLLWQMQVLQWENEWDIMAPDAAVQLAAMADAQTFFLGSQGLVSHLDQIGLVFSEEDSAVIAEALEDWQGEQ